MENHTPSLPNPPLSIENSITNHGAYTGQLVSIYKALIHNAVSSNAIVNTPITGVHQSIVNSLPTQVVLFHYIIYLAVMGMT